MSLYARYLEEKTDDKIFETDEGYATYEISIEKETCYIKDIFILPEYRQMGKAAELANTIVKIAKNVGCNKLLGSVIPSAKGSTESISVLVAYGMKLDSSTNNFILFSKEI